MNRSRKPSRFGVPLLGLGMGVVFLVAAWLGGNPALGWAMFGIMAAYSAILVLAGRFDAIQVLRGTPADERYRSFETRATVAAANVTIVFVLVMAVIDVT